MPARIYIQFKNVVPLRALYLGHKRMKELYIHCKVLSCKGDNYSGLPVAVQRSD